LYTFLQNTHKCIIAKKLDARKIPEISGLAEKGHFLPSWKKGIFLGSPI
jgi:hypothetical protein